MSKQIFRAMIPWFEPYTIGLLWGDEDPHKAKGSLFSNSEDTNELRFDTAFVNHIICLQEELTEARAALALIASPVEFYCEIGERNKQAVAEAFFEKYPEGKL